MNIAKIALKRIKTMELIMEGATVWDLDSARQIRDLQKAQPKWVKIIDDLKELEGITGENYDGAEKVPYFGAILTDMGKGALETLLGWDQSVDDPPGLKEFSELWYHNLSPSLWCEKYAHPLHRICPVILNYESLPEPFKKAAESVEHEGKTGDRVQAKPETCFGCDRNIRNDGTCDPL